MQHAMNFQAEEVSESIALASCEQSELFIYRFTCPLKAIVDENRNGCGWDRVKNDEDIDEPLGLVDKREALEKLRNVVADLDGQELATYCDDENVKAIDVIIVSTQEAQFFVHFSEEPTQAELEAFKEDLSGQLSDGFGEILEQTDLGLEVRQDSFYSSSRGDDIEWNVMFGFDYDRVSEPQPYDPNTMFSLDQIEVFKSLHQVSPSRTGIRP